MTRIICGLAVVFFTHSLSAAPVPDSHYCEGTRCENYNEAVSFVAWDKLSAEQSRVLLNSGIGPEIWADWTAEHDDQAAAFLAITDSLSHMTLKFPDGSGVNADKLLVRVNTFKGDRIFAKLDREAFDAWRESGGAFELRSVSGKVESGKFTFHNGTSWGGSLHKGFDIQGFTSITKVPRIQINFRLSDSEADIDIDGYIPLIWGFIPNPKHLTYKNSDPRQWLSVFTKKFGDPGFAVSTSKFVTP